MRVLSSTYGSRRGVEPVVGLAVRPGALAAEVRVCAPPDFAEPLAGVGVPPVSLGQPVRPPAAAEECDAPVAADVVPNVAPR
jgi:vancomycin aglycone glucosyltransferase